jgi:transducin (beta)-like 1
MSHDDWVSSVAGHSSKDWFLTGSYDGAARIWNAEGEILTRTGGHSSAIRDVSWVAKDDKLLFASASMDETVRIWQLKEDKKLSAEW